MTSRSRGWRVVVWVVATLTAWAQGASLTPNPNAAKSPEAVERLLHRRNNAVLENAGLGSIGAKLDLIDADNDDSPYLASYQVDAWKLLMSSGPFMLSQALRSAPATTAGLRFFLMQHLDARALPAPVGTVASGKL